MNFDNVKFMEDAKVFMDGLDPKTRNKVYYNIRKAQHVKDDKLLKKLDKEIWEFRTLYNKTKIRLFAFWDKSDSREVLVIATHGIMKQTAKIPTDDLKRANRLRTTYFELKE